MSKNKRKSRINQDILLKRTSIYLLLTERSMKVPAKAILQLSPRPRLAIEFELQYGGYDDTGQHEAYGASNEIRPEEILKIRLERGINIDTLLGDIWHMGGGKLSNILVPVEQPLTVVNEGVKINKCNFGLINFPSVWGKQDEQREGTISQNFELQTHLWSIDIKAIEGLPAVDYKLKKSGGSAITHFGHITRTDRQDFSLGELESLLEGLHLFLSFSRGSYCGVAFLSGQDSNGKRVWQQWGSYKVEPWERELPSWVWRMGSERLSSAFAGFWDRFNSAPWADTIAKATHWYLRSNESNELETSIILSHAALERLAFELVGPKSGPTGEWMAKAITQCGIDHKIPASCTDLGKLGNLRGYEHGPHALAEIRNDLVHPERKHGNISPEEQCEAWNLAQWYIELILLHLCDYKGNYWNRLTRKEEDIPMNKVA